MFCEFFSKNLYKVKGSYACKLVRDQTISHLPDKSFLSIHLVCILHYSGIPLVFHELLLFRSWCIVIFHMSSLLEKAGWQWYNELYNKMNIKIKSINRSGSRAAATFNMERFVIIVNGFQPLTIITKCSILDVAVVLDPPLWPMWNSIKSSLKLEGLF